ncbi:NAD(P)-binding domain-containing protein, partial [Clavibacter michiganensis]|uniref:NAD(P)-binding domain-containing protein n=1 Tax=Clavibacter michiganensis TaxID=28447 RepID=UPI0029310DD1
MSPTDPLDPTTPRRIGVVGLGSMGGAMAASLAGRGWDVVGCDPSAAVRDPVLRDEVETRHGLVERGEGVRDGRDHE